MNLKCKCPMATATADCLFNNKKKKIYLLVFTNKNLSSDGDSVDYVVCITKARLTDCSIVNKR